MAGLGQFVLGAVSIGNAGEVSCGSAWYGMAGIARLGRVRN